MADYSTTARAIDLSPTYVGGKVGRKKQVEKVSPTANGRLNRMSSVRWELGSLADGINIALGAINMSRNGPCRRLNGPDPLHIHTYTRTVVAGIRLTLISKFMYILLWYSGWVELAIILGLIPAQVAKDIIFLLFILIAVFFNFFNCGCLLLILYLFSHDTFCFILRMSTCP